MVTCSQIDTEPTFYSVSYNALAHMDMNGGLANDSCSLAGLPSW